MGNCRTPAPKPCSGAGRQTALEQWRTTMNLSAVLFFVFLMVGGLFWSLYLRRRRGDPGKKLIGSKKEDDKSIAPINADASLRDSVDNTTEEDK